MQTVISLIIGMSFFITNPTHVTTKKVDVAESVVTWKGQKVTGSHEGTIKIKEGQLEYDHDVLKGGMFTIDMTSIACTDLKPGGAEKLVGHLNSDDFFGIATYPTATFKITKVVKGDTAGDYTITGDLTIKEKTNPITFNATAGGNVANATLKVDRTKYDIKYGSGSFFDNLGDKTIYDDFDLTINLVTK